MVGCIIKQEVKTKNIALTFFNLLLNGNISKSSITFQLDFKLKCCVFRCRVPCYVC